MASNPPTDVPSPPISMIASSYIPSILRTVVPIIYSMLVKWGVVSFIDPNDMFITNLITVTVTGLIYIGLRVLERYWDKIGWLLGYAKQPVYVQGQVLAVKEIPTNPTTTTEVETDVDPAGDDKA